MLRCAIMKTSGGGADGGPSPYPHTKKVKLREHARLAENRHYFEAEDRRCPRCRQGWLNEWTGICSACGYPEFNEDEPCYNCEDEDCDKCEYARKLREKLMER